MSDRKNAYFLQLVDEGFFDECFDDLEAADRLLAVDMGFLGIVSGVVASQHVAPPDLTVDITSGVSYDQAGRRCGITSNVNAFNCAVDENSVSTAVAGGGNERWISIQLRFDRTLSDLQTDGNGNPVYVDQDESYELAVVMANEFAVGTNTKPALPADGRLVCDIQLIFGQTQILNADIYVDRRQVFTIFTGAAIPVVSGGWSFLNPATDDVQATFDFIDSYSLVTDSSTELLQHIIPSVAGRNLGEAAKEWDLYVLELVTVAASRVDGHLLPKVTGNNLGESGTPLEWSLYSDFIDLNGNLDLDGQIITSAGSRVNGNLLPFAGTEALGSAALRWAGFLDAVTLYSTMALSSANSTTNVLDCSEFILDGTWVLNGTQKITATDGSEVILPLKGIPDGAEITQIKVRWAQSAAGGGAANFGFYKRAFETAARTQVGGSTNIGGYAADRTDTLSGLTETIDRSGYEYVLIVQGGIAVANTDVYQVEVSYNYTNLLSAIQAS